MVYLVCPRPVFGQECGFDPYQHISKKERRVSDSLLHVGPKEDELVALFPAPPAKASEVVMDLLVNCKLPVSANNNGAIEVKLPREIGMFAQYEITAHAYVVSDRGGSRVTLFAEESRYSGRAISPDVSTSRVDNRGQGRAFRVWRALSAIHDYLGQDSVLAVYRQDSQPTTPAVEATVNRQTFVGSISKKLFMVPSCPLAAGIAAEDKVVFGSEQEAKSAGFLRSGAEGC
jgi:hypothetical protein